MRIYIFLFCMVMMGVFACQKETSFEKAGLTGNAVGTLLDSSGNCQSIVTAGVYAMDSVLKDSNYLLVKVNITTAGKYNIYTDTVNGMWFADSSFILTTGAKIIKIKGYGKPILPIISTFTIFFNSSFCNFTINCGSPIVTPPPTPTVPNIITVSTENDYFPLSVNSNWTYDVVDGSTTDTLRITALSGSKTINGNTYRVTRDVSGDTTLARKDGAGKYYYYRSYATGVTDAEYLFLDDNLPLGGTWTKDLTGVQAGNAFELRVIFTIDAKNISTNINGNALDSVIRVKEDLYIKTALGTYQYFLSGYSSYAKKIGLVFYDFISYNYTQKLKRCKIF